MCGAKILPKDPLDDNSDWTCSNGCQMRLKFSQVSQVVADLKADKDGLSRTDLQVKQFCNR